MKDMGATKRILGMEIRRERLNRKLFLSQKSYIARVITRFRMQGAKPVVTPFAPHFMLSNNQSPSIEAETKNVKCIPYASAVNNLIYAMVYTRPDISHAVSMVSRFMKNLGKAR